MSHLPPEGSFERWLLTAAALFAAAKKAEAREISEPLHVYALELPPAKRPEPIRDEDAEPFTLQL